MRLQNSNKFPWFLAVQCKLCQSLKADRNFILTFLGIYTLRASLLSLTSLDLAPDEAYYWEWSKQLDWSYYSKGPLVALFIRLGTSIFGDTAWGVRSPAFFSTAFFSLLFYYQARIWCGSNKAYVVWLLLESSLVISYMSLVMTTDPIFIMFWMLSTMAALRTTPDITQDSTGHGTTNPNALLYWIPAFVFAGLAVLAKYTAAVLPVSFFVYLYLQPKRRHELFSREFIAAVLCFSACLLPVIFWNIEHGWINYRHNIGHLSHNSGFGLSTIKPLFFLELLGSQIGLAGLLSVALLWWSWQQACVSFWRRDKSTSGEALLLLASIFPLVALCCGVALTRRVYANWPLPIIINLFLLLAFQLRKQACKETTTPTASPPMVSLTPLSQRFERVSKHSLRLNMILLVSVSLLFAGYTFNLPPHRLPTKKMVGWQTLGSHLQSILNLHLNLHLTRHITPQSQATPFILTSRYDQAAEIAFYTNLPGQVLVANIDDRRMTQYDVWAGWDGFKGRNAILVSDTPEPSPKVTAHFRSVAPITSHFELQVSYSGKPLRKFYFFYGTDFDGQPTASPLKY